MDSIAFHFRAEFEDMGARQRMLQSMAQDLLTLAERHQLAVVLMNQVTTRMDHKSSGYSGSSGSNGTGESQIVAALGESWAHVCSTRVTLHWNGEQQRCARIIKSPSRKDTTVEFEITIKGVRKRSSAQKRKAATPNPSAGVNDANSMTSSSSSSSSSGM
jgi:RAD51-like protein 2